MTTSVKVSAHCSSSKQVRISKTVSGVVTPDIIIKDSETHETVVYDDIVLSVKEEEINEATAIAL